MFSTPFENYLLQIVALLQFAGGTIIALAFHMPRYRRILPKSGMFHIICRGNNGVRIFRNKMDFNRFRFKIKKYTNDILHIHNYTLMHTHFHMLCWCNDTSLLAKTIKKLCLSYYQYYVNRYSYRGHLWHGRYRSIIIEDEIHWLQCGRYIELNPVHAGLCEDPKDYPWSSYHYYANGRSDPIMKPIYLSNNMDKWEKDVENKMYRDFVLDGIDIDYQQMKKRYELGQFS